jgi:hypothetical protein
LASCSSIIGAAEKEISSLKEDCPEMVASQKLKKRCKQVAKGVCIIGLHFKNKWPYYAKSIIKDAGCGAMLSLLFYLSSPARSHRTIDDYLDIGLFVSGFLFGADIARIFFEDVFGIKTKRIVVEVL